MNERGIQAVTGAFGYSGSYIANRLLDKGRRVITLTNSPDRPNPFGDRVQAYPYNFDNPEALAETLSGVSVLYNTYWVRFNYKTFTHAQAVANTGVLFEAAKRAGVERVVHISITNPAHDSPVEYFRCKAEMEQTLLDTGISHAILRPALLFGGKDILVNNIAWSLRRMPVFGVFGRGDYKVQPIHVDDLAELAARYGESRENIVVNAIGPETFTFRELVIEVGRIIGKRRPVIGVPTLLGYVFASVIGRLNGDVMLTRDEVRALMLNLLYVDAPPAGKTKLTDWAKDHASTLGLHYASELSRRRT